MNKYFFIFISTFLYLSTIYSFTIHINNHYSSIVSNIFNINSHLIDNNDNAFTSIDYYNNNKSICFSLHHKNKFKLLLKDKYNYLASFECHKYKYLILLKSKPISYNYTEFDIDIRQDRIKNRNNTNINFEHYKRINNIIYKYINYNIIYKNKEELSTELFKFFNNY